MIEKIEHFEFRLTQPSFFQRKTFKSRTKILNAMMNEILRILRKRIYQQKVDYN